MHYIRPVGNIFTADDNKINNRTHQPEYFNLIFMKKTVLFLVSGTLSLFVFVACGSSSKADEKAVDNAVNQLNSAAQSTNSTSSSTETSTETTTSDASASTSTSSSSTEDWDAILNDYEEYVNQYIKLMKAAQKGDASAMSEYPAMLEKANSLNSKLTSGQGTMSSAQASRLLKIQNKLASAAAGM